MKDVKRYRKVPDFLEKHPHIVTTYPRLFNEVAKLILEVDDMPKSEKLKLTRKKIKEEVSLARFLWDMYKAWRTLL
jgi:electron transfer flavoprotein-quinone oxidoreductase